MLTILSTRLKERICLNKTVSMDEIMPLIREQIENNGEVTFTPKGNSMMPMLRNNKDTVTLKKAEFPLRKYDLPLFIREDGSYVLHRVVRIEDDAYVMRGDNQFADEHGITKEQIIGIVHSFKRKNKRYDCKSKVYCCYCRVWVNSVKIRKYIRLLRRIIGKIKRKIVRTFK